MAVTTADKTKMSDRDRERIQNKMVHPSPSRCLSLQIVLLYLVVIQQLRGEEV